MAVPVNEITKLLTDYRALSREAFLAKYVSPVLLHQTNPGDSTGVRGYLAGLFRRRLFSSPTLISARPETDRQTSRSDSGMLVFGLHSKKGGGFSNIVMVGRGSDSDIELPYDKVSKLHAYFSCNEEGDDWTVSDMHTTTGTFVNGVRLPPETPVHVVSGAVLKFGSAELVFFSPAALHDHISSLVAGLGQPPVNPGP